MSDLKTVDTNNKMIAEFMEGTLMPISDVEAMEVGEFPEDELKYDDSWDWLMPVCSKIDDLCREDLSARGHLESADEIAFMFGDLYVTTDITSVYHRVVEFIKWYNEHRR